jgi:hypothetical protein
MTGSPMTPDDFHFACTMFDNRQRLIAAGKLQRWDVVKWTITINVALAAAAIAFKDEPRAGSRFFYCAVCIAIIGWVLMMSYNLRLTRTREQSLVTEEYLDNNGIGYEAIAGEKPTRAKWWYDWQELLIFSGLLLISIVPTFAVWLLEQ